MRPLYRRSVYSEIHTLSLLGFLFGVVYGMFSLALPILSDGIFSTIGWIGIVFAIPELFGVFADVPIGAFASHFGRRRAILLSGTLLAASAALFMIFRSPLIFLVLLIFYELATQLFIIPADAEAMALTPNTHAGRINGMIEGLHNFGYSLGPIAVGVAMFFGMRAVFAVIFGISVLLVLTSVRFSSGLRPHESFRRSFLDVLKKDHVFQKSFHEFLLLRFKGVFLVFAFFIFAFHWGFIAIAEPLYTKALGLSELAIGLVYAGFTLPILFIGIMAGKFIDRNGGGRTVLATGIFLMAISTIGFGVFENVGALFILSIIAGIGDALLLPAGMAGLDTLSSYHAKEHISGIKTFAESAGYFLGPIAVGVLGTFFGLRNSFLAIGILLMIFSVMAIAMPYESRQRS